MVPSSKKNSNSFYFLLFLTLFYSTHVHAMDHGNDNGTGESKESYLGIVKRYLNDNPAMCAMLPPLITIVYDITTNAGYEAYLNYFSNQEYYDAVMQERAHQKEYKIAKQDMVIKEAEVRNKPEWKELTLKKQKAELKKEKIIIESNRLLIIENHRQFLNQYDSCRKDKSLSQKDRNDCEKLYDSTMKTIKKLSKNN